jgi:hypothetical protein
MSRNRRSEATAAARSTMAIDQDRSERSLRGFCGNCKLRRLPRHATVRSQANRMAVVGRTVKLYIATPMHSCQLCIRVDSRQSPPPAEWPLNNAWLASRRERQVWAVALPFIAVDRLTVNDPLQSIDFAQS